jgi:hypothetical protein
MAPSACCANSEISPNFQLPQIRRSEPPRSFRSRFATHGGVTSSVTSSPCSSGEQAAAAVVCCTLISPMAGRGVPELADPTVFALSVRRHRLPNPDQPEPITQRQSARRSLPIYRQWRPNYHLDMAAHCRSLRTRLVRTIRRLATYFKTHPFGPDRYGV